MGMQLILCPLTSLRTLRSPAVPTWLNFDSEVLWLPITSPRLGYHKFGSSWLGSAGCQSPDRIRLCPSWLSFYGFSVSSRSTHTDHQLRRFWNPRGKLGSYGPFSCEALSSTKRHCEVAMRKSVLRILQQDQDRRCENRIHVLTKS